jgi:hypothetical protein
LKNLDGNPQNLLKEYEMATNSYEANVRELEKKIEKLQLRESVAKANPNGAQIAHQRVTG